MENNAELKHEKSFIKRVLYNKAFILIILGIVIRVIMLFYYYYTHSINPLRSWGDLGSYFGNNLTSTPLTIFILEIFRFLSFGSIEMFAFWGFLWDLLTTLMFYFIIKNFNVKNLNYAFGLFMINPFFFLSNSFSIENCGYHITDAFFFFFLFLAFINFPKKQKYSKYLFYLFLGLSMCIKYYTLPAVGFFFLKYLIDKDWKEMKIFLISIAPLLIIFLILPLFLTDWFFNILFNWYSVGISIPLFIKIIPPVSIALLFIIFRMNKSDAFEISILSTVTTASFMVFSYFYLRWFQSILFYGVLKEKEFFTLNLNLGFKKREIIVNNHLITFYLSFLGVLLAYLLIIFVYS